MVPSHCQSRKKFQHLVRGSYYAAPSYYVIHDVFVLFTPAKDEVIWFITLVSDKCLPLVLVKDKSDPVYTSLL